MRVFPPFALMAVLFLSSCATVPVRPGASVTVSKAIVSAKTIAAKVPSAMAAPLQKALDQAQTALEDYDKKYAEVVAKSEYWHQKQLKALEELKVWRWIAMAVALISLSGVVIQAVIKGLT